MKENTVLLKLEDYNALKDFQKGILEGKLFKVNCYGEDVNRFGAETYHFVSEKKVIKHLHDKCKFLKEKLIISEEVNASFNFVPSPPTDDYKTRYELASSLCKMSDEVKNLKSFSVWEFLKWRKK